MISSKRPPVSFPSLILIRNVMYFVTLLLITITVIAGVTALGSSGSVSTTSAVSSRDPSILPSQSVEPAVSSSSQASLTSQLTLPPETTSDAIATQATSASETLTATEESTRSDTESDLPDLSGLVVVLDPGHQTHANNDQEPVAPGSDKTKAKCSSGTQGVSTGRQEYDVNLEISFTLQDYLESLGCTVYMTRTENDVNLSNIERAEFALSKDPDVYLRIHCNGSDDSSTRGICVFVADSGTYRDQLPEWGELLGQSLANTTGSEFLYCSATSVYSGLNWATDIPSFLLELGFMTNPEEDELLSDSSYQKLICQGVASFLSDM